jgi:hypothetical protein
MNDTTHTFGAADHTLAFMLAGNARLTIKSGKTGVRYTYRVARAKEGDAYFVSLLTGSDNESDYTYMGLLRNLSFGLTRASRYGTQTAPVLGFTYVLRALAAGTMPANVEINHEGRCGRCGRALTVPESVASGIGPECALKMAA